MTRTTRVPEQVSPWPGQGTVLAGRYRLVEFLASGGAAALWRAHDPQLDREVALKLLHPHHHRNATVVERFRREALTIARLRHPNVVRIFDTVQHDGTSFLVMEYVEGVALSQWQGHALDGQVVAALGHQVACALGAAHEQHLVHRDVKPDNIVVDAVTGRVKLLDFGITKDLRHVTGLTGPHQVVATTRYAAPEQISDGPVGPWTDVYSLGLVLWEACTGRAVFDGPTDPAIALARLREDPLPVEQCTEDVPVVLGEVIHRATRRDHRDRYADGGQMATDLYGVCGPRAHELSSRLDTSAPPPRTAPASHRPQPA